MRMDFEKRYSRQPLHRPADKIREQIINNSQELAKRMQNRPGRLPSLVHFEELFTTQKRKQELMVFPWKVIGTFCFFAPEELILAAGAVPIRLCSGHSETIITAEEALPRDICPLVKSSFGFCMIRSGWIERCDAIILPTTCDAKTKLGEYLADYLPVWIMNLPKIKDYQATKKVWLQELVEIKTKLEKLIGHPIKPHDLRAAILLLKQRAQVYRKMYELRLQHPGIISHQDWLMLIQASFYADPHRWIMQAEKLFTEMQAKVKLKDYPAPGKRLMLTGGPILWPNYKILNIIEELGSSVVVDDLCVGHQRLWDYAEPDEWTEAGMMEAINSRCLFPAVCPCFTTSYDRVDKILHLAEEAKVDGVIYHDLRLCQLFDMEKDLVSKVLKQRKMPVLILHTDYGQEDVEQLRTRIEAFLEMIL